MKAVLRKLMAAEIPRLHHYMEDVWRWVLREVEELPDHAEIRAVLQGYPLVFWSPAMWDRLIAKEVGEYNRAQAFLREHNERVTAEIAAARARGEHVLPGYGAVDMEALRRAAEGTAPKVRIAVPKRIVPIAIATDEDVFLAAAQAEAEEVDHLAPVPRRVRSQ